MSIIIETNDEKELSGNANGVYFVVYKDKLNSLTPSDTLALVQAADELATLRAQLAEARELIADAKVEIGFTLIGLTQPSNGTYNKLANYLKKVTTA